MPRFFFFYRALSFFIFNPRSCFLPPLPPVRSFVLHGRSRNPFLHFKERRYPRCWGDPLDSLGVWILTGDKRSEKSNEISTSFTVKVCLILKYHPRDGKLLNAWTRGNHTVICILGIIRRLFTACRK